MWGGAILDSLCRVGRSVGPSPILVRSITPLLMEGQIFNKQYYTLCRVCSITPLLMEGFPSNLNDTFTSTRGCA